MIDSKLAEPKPVRLLHSESTAQMIDSEFVSTDRSDARSIIYDRRVRRGATRRRLIHARFAPRLLHSESTV
jgi:hypothetical protein